MGSSPASSLARRWMYIVRLSNRLACSLSLSLDFFYPSLSLDLLYPVLFLSGNSSDSSCRCLSAWISWPSRGFTVSRSTSREIPASRRPFVLFVRLVRPSISCYSCYSLLLLLRLISCLFHALLRPPAGVCMPINHQRRTGMDKASSTTHDSTTLATENTTNN